jgi:uncharacterized membrane protein
MATAQKELLPFGIIALMFLLAAYCGPLLKTDGDGNVAVHWGIDGKADAWANREVGLFGWPILALIIYVALTVIPKLDVYSKNIEGFAMQYWGFRVVLVFVMCVMYAATLISNLGYWERFDIMIVVVPSIALLFFYVGYMLNYTKRNYFIGVRTPWTLASEKVWEKTNRLAGSLFWICAALTIISLVAPSDIRLWVIVVPAILVAIVASAYSYLEYRKTKKAQSRKGRKKR